MISIIIKILYDGIMLCLSQTSDAIKFKTTNHGCEIIM